MTQRQERFCYNYVSNGYNAVKAYADIGGKAKEYGSLKAGAFRFMEDEEVKAFIRDLINKTYENLNVNAETIATELANVAFQRPTDESRNYNETCKLKALELLQKQLGLQTINQNITGQVIEVDIEE